MEIIDAFPCFVVCYLMLRRVKELSELKHEQATYAKKKKFAPLSFYAPGDILVESSKKKRRFLFVSIKMCNTVFGRPFIFYDKMLQLW